MDQSELTALPRQLLGRPHHASGLRCKTLGDYCLPAQLGPCWDTSGSFAPFSCTPNSAGAEIGRCLVMSFLLPLSADAPSHVALLGRENTGLGLKMVYYNGLVDSCVGWEAMDSHLLVVPPVSSSSRMSETKMNPTLSSITAAPN
jgi:hypothetical protein